jgi:hypothetical protein
MKLVRLSESVTTADEPKTKISDDIKRIAAMHNNLEVNLSFRNRTVEVLDGRKTVVSLKGKPAEKLLNNAKLHYEKDNVFPEDYVLYSLDIDGQL